MTVRRFRGRDTAVPGPVPSRRAVALSAVLISSAALAPLGLAAPAQAAAPSTTGVQGSGVSNPGGGEDKRHLVVTARTRAGATSGRVVFQHHSATGLARFVGTVTCVSTSGDLTTIAGVVATGQNTSGVSLDGRTYAFTITTGPDQQSFSLPAFDVSTTTCDGSDRRQVPVTSGHLRTSA